MEYRPVSIVIPYVKGKEGLESSLASLCKQTYRELEILCLEDGADDQYDAIIKQFCESHDYIKTIHYTQG